MTINQIKRELYRQGISQTEFAQKLGISRSQLCQWLNGHRNPSKAARLSMELVLKLNKDIA